MVYYLLYFVVNGNGEPVQGVSVIARWHIRSWNDWCTTDNEGSCIFQLTGINSSENSSVRLHVARLSNWRYQYMPQYNTEPDRHDGSNGTTITVRR